MKKALVDLIDLSDTYLKLSGRHTSYEGGTKIAFVMKRAALSKTK